MPANPRSASYVHGLAADDYIRRRLSPRITDVDYPTLTDLLKLVEAVAPGVQGKVLDYGCGGAPYRRLFARCEDYIAADMEPGPAVDLVLQPDGKTGQADASLDFVLSTQVFEHLRDPYAYLGECLRVLRSGGKLLLTTHGMFEEHGCPFDFYRWTSAGLRQAVGNCGFRVIESGKLTTEVRAFAQLSHQMMAHLRCRERPLWHYFLAMFRKSYYAVGVPLLNLLARCFPQQSRSTGDAGSSLYACVYVIADKPE